MKQFKTNEWQESNKLHLDKYYTPKDICKYVVDKTKEICVEICEFIEPSAGKGNFLDYLPKGTLAYDIEPEDSRITEQDYLALDIKYKKGRCVVGNPPYGRSLNLARAFCNKSFEIADYVSFILPISQLNNDNSIYKFDLIYSENLGRIKFTDREVPVCLNIYKRPKFGLNKRKSYKDSIIEIKEVTKQRQEHRRTYIGDFKYDVGICAWGAAIGKEVYDEDEYARSFWICIKDRDNVQYYKDLILNADWQSIYHMTGTPVIAQWQVYKYVEDNKILGVK